jgi:hypothetical protein
MPTLQPYKARRTPLAVKLSLGVCLLLGLLLLVVSLLMNPVSNREGNNHEGYSHLVPNLLHDLGIAFCVSFAVAGLFEIYRSVRHQIENFRDVIDFVMGEQITPDVWMEVKELIEAKRVIRRGVVLRLELQRDPSLDSREAILKVEHQYDLFPLCEKSSKYTIEHELDYQFKHPSLNLPSWELAVVVPDVARTQKDEIDLSSPCLKVEVSLPRRDKESIFVQTRRRELVYLPGSYNFYIPEFTQGFRLTIVGCPPEIGVEVLVRPHGGGQALPNQDGTWSSEQLIFPGQGIEVKFVQRDSTRSHSVQMAVPATENETPDCRV